jgi:uncharacterized membrane protein YhfC
MLAAMYVVAILVEIGLPIGLALVFLRRYRLGWGLVGVGVLTFIGSQVVHIPLLYGITYLFQTGILPPPPTWTRSFFNPVLLGLLAGLCEETARWVGYRILKQKANSWGAALTLGAGHGGVESIVIGILVLVNFTLVVAAGSNGSAQLGISPAIVKAFWQTPWNLPLAGAIERISTVTLHIFLSVLVWKAVSKGNAWWYIGAVLYHALVDGVSVYFSQLGWSAWNLEALIFGFTIVSLAGLWWVNGLNQPDDDEIEEEDELDEQEASEELTEAESLDQAEKPETPNNPPSPEA